MLYVETEVNGHAVKAFVDSGAQATISPSSFLVLLVLQSPDGLSLQCLHRVPKSVGSCGCSTPGSLAWPAESEPPRFSGGCTVPSSRWAPISSFSAASLLWRYVFRCVSGAASLRR